MELADIVAAFARRFGLTFRPAAPFELTEAERAGVPEVILRFYRRFEPNEAGTGEVQLFPIKRLLQEMSDSHPGRLLQPHGYIPIAATNRGDLYFVRPARSRDYAVMAVYLFRRKIDLAGLSDAQVEEFCDTVALGLPDFLTRAVCGELMIRPSD